VESTKDRIVGASAELFRRQGYAGTGVKQIVAEANAPFGSLYHFFPGGKEELGAETIRWSGRALPPADRRVLRPEGHRRLGRALLRRGGRDGPRDRLRRRLPDRHRRGRGRQHERAAASGHRRRVRELDRAHAAGYMAQAGIPEERARELAISTLAILEGAFLLSRAGRDTAPMAIAGATAAAAVRAALSAQ